MRLPRPCFAGPLFLALFATNALAQNSNLSDHERYIHNQTEQNTRYFNNADSYPKPTSNALRYYPPDPSRSHDSNDWGQPQVVLQVHIPTHEEIAADYSRKSAAGDVQAKISLANCYYFGWGVPLNKTEAFRLYREASTSNVHAEFVAGILLFDGEGVPANLTEGRSLIQHAAAAGDADAIAWTPLIQQALTSAAKGDVPAMAQAGVQYLSGIGVEKNPAKGLNFLEQAANHGDVQSMENLCYWYRSRTTGVPYDFKRSHDWELKAAEAGSVEAMLVVGMDLVANEGISVDAPKALKWLTLAASKGNVTAAENVGVLYNGGYDGVPTDRAKAVTYYRQAMVGGAKTAGRRLALLYEGSDHAAPESAKAISLLKELIAKGDADAESYLGDDYALGRGVDKDLDQSIAWLTKSAQHGSARGAYQLATHYFDGEGVSMQVSKGMALIQQAVVQDFAPAIWTLGMAKFFHEFGVDQDEYEGTRLLRIAADKGDDSAPFTLGEIYDIGVNVEKDHQAALNWFWIGASRGNDRCIMKLKEAGLWAEAKRASLPGEPRTASTDEGVQLDTVSNEPAKATKERVPPQMLPEPWTTIADPQKLTPAEATAARERILHTRERSHSFTDYAYLMLAKLYAQAKSADPKLTQRTWVLAIHDRALAGDEEAGYLWGAARVARFAVGLGPDQELEHYMRAMMTKGKPEAERDYAILCIVGNMGEPDMNEAYRLAEKSADGGLPSAQSLLGEWYWDGKGVDVDKIEAGNFWKRAADAGDPIAQYYYGANTASGDGLPKDEAAGLVYLRKSAEAGYDPAMLDYGIALDIGLYGQTKDVDLGTMYIDRAALAGNVTAQNFMGKKYEAGKGVAQNDEWACVYWRAAAQNGNVDAQYSLGRALLDGKGVANNRTEAIKWLTEASAHDNTDATDLLDQLAKEKNEQLR